MNQNFINVGQLVLLAAEQHMVGVAEDAVGAANAEPTRKRAREFSAACGEAGKAGLLVGEEFVTQFRLRRDARRGQGFVRAATA